MDVLRVLSVIGCGVVVACGSGAISGDDDDDRDGGAAPPADAGIPDRSTADAPMPASTIGQLGAPFDVQRNDLVGPADHNAMYGKPPEIIALAQGTSIDVLWQDRTDESTPRAFVVRLQPSGDDYVVTRAAPVATLDRIMGFAADDDGNYFVATGIVESLHEPITVNYPAPGQYRSDVVHVTKLDSAGQILFETDVDTAREAAGGSPELVINPMVAASSRLAYRDGTVALVHGINTDPDSGGTRHQKALTTHFDAASGAVTRASSIWVSHSFDQRLFDDGQGFIETHLGDAYPRSIAFARVGPDSGSYHLFHIKGPLGDNNTFTRLGGVVPLDGSATDGWGYLALVATEQSTGTDPVGSASRIAGSRDLALVRVRSDFEAADRDEMEHVDQGFGVTQTVIASGDERTNYVRWMTDYHTAAPGQTHAERPKLVALGNDRYALLWERWELDVPTNDVDYVATHGMIIDGEGEIVVADTMLTDVHLPRGDDALAVAGRAVWITGDEERRELHVHIVDEADDQLTYRRVVIE